MTKMSSWRDVLRQRQLAIDAADKEEFEVRKKATGITCSQESINSAGSYGDISQVSMLSTPCTEPAAVHLLVNDVPDAQLPTSDDLMVGRECICEPAELEQPITYGIDKSCSSVDHREVASVDSSVVEVKSDQLSPGELIDEQKSDVDLASDGTSLDSFGCIESDLISNSVIDSSKSVTSTPEHLVSTDVSYVGSPLLNCTSESPEKHIVDEVPKTATSVDLSLDTQLPVHKRTRRHGRRHGTHHAKRKDECVVEQVEIELADDVLNIQWEVETPSSEPADAYLMSVPELDGFQSQPSDVDVEVIPDAAEGDELSTQVVRHPSYLKAVSTASENPVTSQHQGVVVESTGAQSSKDYLISSFKAVEADSKYSFLFLLDFSYAEFFFLSIFLHDCIDTPDYMDKTTNLWSMCKTNL